jgi:hypothetical protein
VSDLNTPGGWSDIEAALRSRRVTDVLVPGHIDRDDRFPRFAPLPLVVFVQLDEGALRLESAGQYAYLDARLVDGPTLTGVPFLTDFEEEGDETAFASLGDQLWGDGWTGPRCTDVRLLRAARPTADPAHVTCLALQLEDRFWLFFDPTWTFGIKVGNAEDLRRWEQDYGSGSTA